LLALVLLLAPATAGASETSKSEIVPGLTINGATISGSGPEDGRTLDGAQASLFLQGWFAPTLAGSPTFADPPKGADSYRITTDYVYLGDSGSYVANVALSGDSMWMSLPAQMIWPGFGVSQDQADHWFVAPPVAQSAFGASSAATTVAPASGSSSGTPMVVILVLVVALIVVIASAVVILRRRSKD